MFDLGLQELIVIFIVALLVFGPKKLPELSRTLGRGMRELKTALHGVKESMDEVEEETQHMEKDISKDVSGSSYTEQPQEEQKPGDGSQSTAPGESNDKQQTTPASLREAGRAEHRTQSTEVRSQESEGEKEKTTNQNDSERSEETISQ